MENKVLVNLYIPFLERHYEVFLPINKKIVEISYLIAKALNEVTGGYYVYKGEERIYNRLTGKEYNFNEIIKHTNIRNGTDIVFM